MSCLYLPKSKVSAGMCKECPKPKNNCPKPQPCGVEQCRDVIKCALETSRFLVLNVLHHNPALNLLKRFVLHLNFLNQILNVLHLNRVHYQDLVLMEVEDALKNQTQNVNITGIKEVAKQRSVNELVNEMLLSDDPKLKRIIRNTKT